METIHKRYLLGYLAVSAISFFLLVMPTRAGVSVPIFMVIQFVCLRSLAPKKKPLLMFIPLFILALNSFISANTMWRVPNFFVSAVLLGVMALWLTGQFSIKGPLLNFMFATFLAVFRPFFHFFVPVEWFAESRKEHVGTFKRVAIGVAIAVPCLIFLLAILSNADLIFSHTVNRFFSWLWRIVNFPMIFRLVLSIVVGLYLFGMIYYIRRANSDDIDKALPKIKERKGDLIILNIVLVSVLLIYTLFVAIQFRYLFANAGDLPFGLTFESYARRGFFELMLLTAINIAFILLAVWLTKERTGKWATLTKILLLYLCAVTAILLVSSFYRMWLHGSDDGLTRMRFMVFGFLIFKAVGLGATFVYVIKPKFNIAALYCAVALTYYLLLNVVPMDAIVARSQIDRYFQTGRSGIHYVMTLSPDAAPQITRLLESDNAVTRTKALRFLRVRFEHTEDFGWRQWNLSIDRLSRLR